MPTTFKDLPGWEFDVDEVSASVFKASGHTWAGMSVEIVGQNPDLLFKECRRVAIALMDDSLRNHAVDDLDHFRAMTTPKSHTDKYPVKRPMRAIQSNEVEITGRWAVRDGRPVADANCDRILDLTQGHLVKLDHDPSGWDTLYRDPDDGRFWEMIFPQSEMQGGGPPQLRCLTPNDMKSKYRNLEAYNEEPTIDPGKPRREGN